MSNDRRYLDLFLSSTGHSNLYTMSASAKKDNRQEIPDTYRIPDEATRLLRARLILEEAVETIEGLGFSVCYKDTEKKIGIHTASFEPSFDPDLEKIIDGCCDVQYVAVGTMLCCGAPDNIHMEIVNAANNAKFPGGEAITDANGKFQKPEGWNPPNHKALMNKFSDAMENVKRITGLGQK